MSSEELRLFDKIRVFLDEDYSSAEHFTVSCDILSDECLITLNEAIFLIKIPL